MAPLAIALQVTGVNASDLPWLSAGFREFERFTSQLGAECFPGPQLSVSE